MKLLSKIKKQKTLVWSAGALAILPFVGMQKVDAAEPSMSNPTVAYQSDYSSATITINGDGTITLPGGHKAVNKAVLSVTKNGVYSFEIEKDGNILTKAVHIEHINKGMLRTNDSNIKLNLTYKDELSGIKEMRFRNEENGTWSSWRDTSKTQKYGTQVVNWKMDSASNGVKRVYAQYKDQAGNITPGEAYDSIIYDTTGPTYNVSMEKYYVKEETFELYVKDIVDDYSNPTNVYVTVGGGDESAYSLKNHDFSKGVQIPFHSKDNKPGRKTVKIQVDDDLGNRGQVKTVEVFFDNVAPSKGELKLKTTSNTDFKTSENGRIWDDGEQTYKYFKGSEEVLLVDSRDIRLDINVGDTHANASGVSKAHETANGKGKGYAKVEVTEVTIETDRYGVVSEKKRKGPVIYDTVDANGRLNVEWKLDYGLEKRLDIVVVDNAGNRTEFKGQSVYMSALALEHFKINDVVNPSYDWTEIDFSKNDAANNNFLSGSNVEFDLSYSLKTAVKPTQTYGELVVVTENVAEGYKHTNTIKLNAEDIKKDRLNPYFGRIERTDNAGMLVEINPFTIPEDAPIGSTVTLSGWLQADLEDGSTLRIYFPDDIDIRGKQVGIVTGSIHDLIQFHSIK